MTPEQLSAFMRAAGFMQRSMRDGYKLPYQFNMPKTWKHERFVFFQVCAWSSGNALYIERIYTIERNRNKGRATHALNSLCAQADKDTITLKLYATNWLGADPFDLVAWYKRFWFVSTGDVYAMERKPK